ncbi:AB hydrolase-1 domain-containing protein [Favolaschia claudopus]|uniref:AB hydrolase-1 domain-containing protein n=1 Tax=Favolaschia claudopus TaxID=2862362 RepID=A0AAW0C9I8_9AGAR
MPFIDLQTSTGLETFSYTLSTPTNASADKIVAGLPTVLFVHPVYVTSAIFHPIFADTKLRRFNLLTMDLRGHGRTSATVDDSYGREVAAHDVLGLIDALKISACHVVGISMGANIALQMAVIAPEKVLSLFLLSPSPSTEPIESLEGRQEIYECWASAFQDADSGMDECAMADAMLGVAQLAYGDNKTSFTKALGSATYDAAVRNWSPSEEALSVMHTVSVEFFQDEHRQDINDNDDLYASASLSRIESTTSILVVHCSEDIIYPRSSAEEFCTLLRRAELDVDLVSLDGAPHFGNATHPDETNAMLYSFLTANCSSFQDIGTAQMRVTSPFLEELKRCGFMEDENQNDSDDSD